MRKQIPIIISILILLLFTGCTKEKTVTSDLPTFERVRPINTSIKEEQINRATPIFKSQDLIQGLKDVGYTVTNEETKTSSYTLFSVYPTYYIVDNEKMAIYEYTDEQDAIKDSKTISDEGSIIGGTVLCWAYPPHFYQKGNIIVSYTGADKKFPMELEIFLGKSITNPL